ncbi:Hint domain-containing protein [Roseovarius sp. EGI FJ00037]|uniref:Hint domain-containing protein n=1 Tax=Roseovarius salincola TaxID=2978479 RepID=UPI0022A85118|nr:Hint domain-containing protein [Roseovarius sp. EGI FJ00037]MCZ0812778.1 Hint domain-containing protein [Roseovarius sp. EGI FJ00037]
METVFAVNRKCGWNYDMWTFWARTDSNSANNPALNLTGDPATQITLVESGTNGDLILDTNGGAPDPDTQVEIGGTLYDFTFELSGELPTQNNQGAGQVPDQFEGNAVYVITVQDYPLAGEMTRLAFLPDDNATQVEMDAFGNGRIDVQNLGSEPAPDYIVEGTNGDDVIDVNYTGDLEGDRIDNNDGNPLQPGTAGGNNDSVTAGAGNDYVVSGFGDDTVFGEDGNDTLVGGTGADQLFGGLGDDEIYLAEGDSADGGDGDDLFVLEDLGEAGSSTITITGGETGETNGDTLQLTPDVSYNDITFTNTDDATGGLSGNFALADGTIVTFSEIENIICFTPGARILTPYGERAIETLKAGDLIITRDNGPQPIRWIGQRTVVGRGNFAPIAINSTVMDNARRPLLVSPQHRLLFTGYKAELLFGQSEVLAAAKHLVNGKDVRVVEREKVTYFHVMLDQHEVVYAEGAATESFHAGDVGISAISAQSREEMFTIFPELRSNPNAYGKTARPCLRKHEARLLAA